MDEQALVERGMVEVRRVLREQRERTATVSLSDLLLVLDSLEWPEPLTDQQAQATYRAIDRLRHQMRYEKT